jgi:Arylsulfotransferase (ASST)
MLFLQRYRFFTLQSSYALAFVGGVVLLLNACSRQPPSYPLYAVTVCEPQSTGYYFLCAIKKDLGPPGVAPVNLLLDSAGRVVYYKVFDPDGNIGDFKLQPNGLMSYSDRDTFYLMDSAFKIVDSVFCLHGIFNDRHDFKVLPNGHYLLLGYEYKIMDLAAFHIKDRNGYIWGKNASVKCGVFEELDENKKLVFEWHAASHFDFMDADVGYWEGPGVLDWTHFNSITCDTDGNYLLSVRNFNEVTKISRGDGCIMWRWGGKHNQFAFANSGDTFTGQHDVQCLPNGDITLYDDGSLNKPLHAATAKEYKLNETAHTATLIWAHTENPHAYTKGLGNVERLSNGNTLIGYGRFMNDSVAFNVIDSAGQKIFELAFKNNLVSYRVFNYAQLPFKLKRPTIGCKYHNGYYILDAGSGHKSYYWNTGSTTRQIVAYAPGKYQVFVPTGNGGYMSSEVLDLK